MTKIDQLRAILELPLPQDEDDIHMGVFDPWRVFDCLYGSYSQEFDDMAIEVLEAIRDLRGGSEPLSHQMFREILCQYGFCDYGTSPRACFATSDFTAMLPELINCWKQYSEIVWE